MEPELKEWWDAWWAEDYSWEGLAKLNDDGTPHKPWKGWCVLPSGDVVQDRWRAGYPEHSSRPAGATAATLQDYWRDQEGALIESPDGTAKFTIMHLPLKWKNGTQASRHHDQKSVLEAKCKASVTLGFFGGGYSDPYPDYRVQTQGAVLRSSAIFCIMQARQRLDVIINLMRIEQSFFYGPISFCNTTFSGHAVFDKAAFCGDADFSGAVFLQRVTFTQTTFAGKALFEKVTFSDEAWFGNAVFFKDVSFSGIAFSGGAYFGFVAFSGYADSYNTGIADFNDVVFCKDASFEEAVFSGGASFQKATFLDTAYFNNTAFSDDTWFEQSVFSRDAIFLGVAFSKTADFNNVAFCRDALFEKVAFSGNATFSRTVFVGDARFNTSAFSGDTRFESAVFSGGAIFVSAAFASNTWFDGAIFGKSADFSCLRTDDSLTIIGGVSAASYRGFNRLFVVNGVFLGEALFDNREFYKPSSFNNCKFLNRASFQGSKLHQGVTFHDAEFETAVKPVRQNEKTEKPDPRFTIPQWVLARLHEAEARRRALKSEDKIAFDEWAENFEKERATAALDITKQDNKDQVSYAASLEDDFRTLKQFMETNRNRQEEARFFRLELLARRNRSSADIPDWERVFSHIYEAVSDFGGSAIKPLVLCLLTIPLFGHFYAWSTTVPVRAPTMHEYYEALSFSGGRVLPVGPWVGEPKPCSVAGRLLNVVPTELNITTYPACKSDLANNCGPKTAFGIGFLATIQSLLALILFFLTALAARRRFQIN